MDSAVNSTCELEHTLVEFDEACQWDHWHGLTTGVQDYAPSNSYVIRFISV